MPGRPRLIDIAERTGVSEATVSRVLNGRGGVGESTRSAVLAVARELGRGPAPAAVGRGDLVGVMVPDLDNPIFAAWVERIEAELFERGHSTLVVTRARTVECEREYFERFVGAGARGIVVVSGHHAQEEGPVGHYRALLEQGIAMVLVNGERDDLDADYVTTDDAQAIRLAVSHLRELGHGAIGLTVGDEHTWPVRTKVQAFEELIEQPGSGASSVAFTDFSYAGGYQGARELVGRGCTAIICGSDVMATGALEGIAAMGLQAPRDVSVVGFDDAHWAGLATPPLTTVRQSVPQMARAAVLAVLAGGDGSRQPARTHLVMPPQLIVRGSTAAAPERRPAGTRAGTARPGTRPRGR